MVVPIVRADYETLGKIAQTFSQRVVLQIGKMIKEAEEGVSRVLQPGAAGQAAGAAILQGCRLIAGEAGRRVEPTRRRRGDRAVMIFQCAGAAWLARSAQLEAKEIEVSPPQASMLLGFVDSTFKALK
jgi:hypothetical protein